jgi:hypothetical protein
MPWVSFPLPLRPLSRKEMEEIEHVRKRMKRSRSRFYSDENFPTRAVELLKEMRIDVQTAKAALGVGISRRVDALAGFVHGRGALHVDVVPRLQGTAVPNLIFPRSIRVDALEFHECVSSVAEKAVEWASARDETRTPTCRLLFFGNRSRLRVSPQVRAFSSFVCTPPYRRQ